MKADFKQNIVKCDVLSNLHLSLLFTEKILDFNRNVDGEVQLSETDLLEFIRIADLSWRGTIIPHLGTLLRWPTGDYSYSLLSYYAGNFEMFENPIESRNNQKELKILLNKFRR